MIQVVLPWSTPDDAGVRWLWQIYMYRHTRADRRRQCYLKDRFDKDFHKPSSRNLYYTKAHKTDRFDDIKTCLAYQNI